MADPPPTHAGLPLLLQGATLSLRMLSGVRWNTIPERGIHMRCPWAVTSSRQLLLAIANRDAGEQHAREKSILRQYAGHFF